MHTAPFTSIRTNCVPKNFVYTIRVDRDVTSPDQWQEELETLALAQAEDTVNIHINTMGGSAATLTAFLHEMHKSPAHLHGILSGNAYSAGGPILLACDSVEVGKFADMMVHTCQGSGFYTHADGRKDNAIAGAEMARNLLTECYHGFMTEDEIELALVGKEYWFNSEEIIRRLLVRAELNAIPAEEDISEEEMSSWSKERILSFMFDDDYDEKVWGISNEDSVTEQLTVDYETTTNIDELKTVANSLDIKLPHNIKLETLRGKILKFLED